MPMTIWFDETDVYTVRFELKGIDDVFTYRVMHVGNASEVIFRISYCLHNIQIYMRHHKRYGFRLGTLYQTTKKAYWYRFSPPLWITTNQRASKRAGKREKEPIKNLQPKKNNKKGKMKFIKQQTRHSLISAIKWPTRPPTLRWQEIFIQLTEIELTFCALEMQLMAEWKRGDNVTLSFNPLFSHKQTFHLHSPSKSPFAIVDLWLFNGNELKAMTHFEFITNGFYKKCKHQTN